MYTYILHYIYFNIHIVINSIYKHGKYSPISLLFTYIYTSTTLYRTLTTL